MITISTVTSGTQYTVAKTAGAAVKSLQTQLDTLGRQQASPQVTADTKKVEEKLREAKIAFDKAYEAYETNATSGGHTALSKGSFTS